MSCDKFWEIIYGCPLFSGVSRHETDLLLEGRYKINAFKTGEVIAYQGDKYKSLMIIGQGCVIGRMVDWNGENIVIEEIKAPRSIAPAILFATDNRLPVDVICTEDCQILSISIDHFTEILSRNSAILINLLRSISDRSKFLSERVKMLRFGTIKKKIALYILENRSMADSDMFVIPHTQQELADMFGVTRPALSRVLRDLNTENVVKTEGKKFTVLDPAYLKAL